MFSWFRIEWANRAVPPFAWAGTLNPPGRYAAGSEFGYALAAPREAPDPTRPWDIAGQAPPWVAISAPGAGKVLLYAVNPGSSAPLALVQELTAPDARRRFGHSLAVGDFDGDGLWDLAVGAPAPGSVPEGRVYVYRGQSGTTPLASSPLTLDGQALSDSASGGVEEDSFGWAVAAGPFVAAHLGDGLMVGAPRSGSDDDGGVCQFTMRASGSGLALESGQCWANKFGSATRFNNTKPPAPTRSTSTIASMRPSTTVSERSASPAPGDAGPADHPPSPRPE